MNTPIDPALFDRFPPSRMPYSIELRNEKGVLVQFHYDTYKEAHKASQLNDVAPIFFTDARGNRHPCAYMFGQKDDELWPDEREQLAQERRARRKAA